MARMIPPDIHSDVTSNAERRVFAAIKNCPNSEQWICLHSLWLSEHSCKRRGEIDFLLITPDGVFVLEVKGGRVARYDGHWVFTNRFGKQNKKNESPFDQASSAMFELERQIARNLGQSRGLPRICYGFGVLFPDIEFESQGTEGSPSQIYDFRDRRRSFLAYYQRLVTYAYAHDKREKSRERLSAEDIQTIADYLRGDFEYIPSLSSIMTGISEDSLRLTEEQCRILDIFHETPRLIVEGSAGTGKTVLAREAAGHLSRKSLHTGLLCFNKNLAQVLQRALTAGDYTNAIACTANQLLFQIVNGSQYRDQYLESAEGALDDKIYKSLLPDFALRAAVDLDKPWFDAVVIDEAQDILSNEFVDILDLLLDGGLEAGKWRVFMDRSNQAAVYRQFSDEAFQRLCTFGEKTILSINCRNTTQIVAETEMLTSPALRSIPRLNGPPVDYHWASTTDEVSSVLQRVLNGLWVQGVRPGSVSILSPYQWEKSVVSTIGWLNIEQISSESVCHALGSKAEKPSFSTVSSFKGLENDIVILCDISEIETDWARGILYVGMTRARSGLHVILSPALKKPYDTLVLARVAAQGQS